MAAAAETGGARHRAFDAWALDGYLKVFWRDAPVWQLWPQVLVLSALAAVFMALARTFARRWEAV